MTWKQILTDIRGLTLQDEKIKKITAMYKSKILICNNLQNVFQILSFDKKIKVKRTRNKPLIYFKEPKKCGFKNCNIKVIGGKINIKFFILVINAHKV